MTPLRACAPFKREEAGSETKEYRGSFPIFQIRLPLSVKFVGLCVRVDTLVDQYPWSLHPFLGAIIYMTKAQ